MPTQGALWRRRGVEPILVVSGFLVAAAYLYRNSLGGQFVSDDWTYIAVNPYVQQLSAENLWAILDPFGAPVRYSMNYAPVQLVLHALQVEWFGSDLRGYHAMQIGLHAIAAALLVALLRRSGLPRPGALLGGLLFLVHPANVEAVGVIYQLKSVLSTLLGFVALLLHPRRPALALTAFALALLTKISALAVLPAAAILSLAAQRDPASPDPRWRWLAGWGVASLLVSLPEFMAFRAVGESQLGLEGGALVQLRTIVAHAMRYLVMAASGTGLSAFHQPPPALSPADPWWLAGLLALALLSWRTGLMLVRRRPEAAWWVMAGAAFAPVSQIFPFLYPVADRYLYAMLPGLLGGALLALHELTSRVGPNLGATLRGRPLSGLLLLLIGGGLVVSFAMRTEPRTWTFRPDMSMLGEAAANYPDGIQAHLLRAAEAGTRSDGSAAATALRAIHDQGWNSFFAIASQPNLRTVRHHPEVIAALREMARTWIEQWQAVEDPTHLELFLLGQAFVLDDQPQRATEALERALELGGPHDAEARQTLRELRRRPR